MKIALYYNSTNANSVALFDALCPLLSQAGVAWYVMQQDLAPDTHCIVVLGGDGTVLRVVPQALQAEVPIWAINGGNVGFLAEGAADLAGKIARLVAGQYVLDRRNTLAVTYDGTTRHALNDAGIVRLGDRLQTIGIVLQYGHETLSYRGDGAILCTATGSTGYSLSTGGPILAPDVRAIVFAPICPHNLHARHIVFGGDDALSMTCTGEGALYIDGTLCATGTPHITVSLSPRQVSFVRFDGEGFFAAVNAKLY